MEDNKKVFVKRETYVKNGKSFYAYFVKGEIKGKEIKASVIPKDIAGYALLDIIFEGRPEVDLVVTPYEMQTEQGEIISGNTYSVKTDDGEVECKIKPNQPTDKTILAYLLK